MKKRGICVLCAVLLLVLQLAACGLINCKESGCDEEIYEDGYCKYHYYLEAGSDILKDIIN